MAKEKEKKNKKKKGGGGILLLILLLIILAILAILFLNGGLGFGAGNGGAIPAIGSVANTEATTSEETPAEISYIDVNVNGDEYLYENSAIGLDALIEKIKGFESPCEVHINVSETATLDAVDALKAELDSNSINYSVIEP